MRSNDEIIDIIIAEKNKQGLSLSKLASRVGMAKSALSRYFNKTRQFPLNKATDFANALGISVEFLLGYSDYKSPIEGVEHELSNPDRKLYRDYGGDSDSPIEPYSMLAIATVGEKLRGEIEQSILELASEDEQKAGRYVNALNKLPTELQEIIVNFLLLPDSSRKAIKDLLQTLFIDLNRQQDKPTHR